MSIHESRSNDFYRVIGRGSTRTRLTWTLERDESRLTLFALMALGTISVAVAQEFPSRPVRMVIPIGPGSSMDITGRVVAQKMNESWNQPVVVDNRPGAGGNIGADVVAKAQPNGYTVLFCSSSLAIARSAYRKLPYDALRDLEPVTQISSRGNVLVVHPSLGVSSVKALIALAKAKPGQLAFGSGGGSSDHLVVELFNLLAGVNITHVPYKSGPQAQNDLIGGQIQVYFGGIPVNLPMIKAGKVKPLGVSLARRSPLLPDVPTVAEAGVPGYEVNVWYGLFAPARHAAARGRQDRCRRQPAAEIARDAGTARRAGSGCRGNDARRVRGAVQNGSRDVGEGRQGGQRAP